MGLLPLWILLIRLIAFPGSIEMFGGNPPSVIGLPAGILSVGVALAVMAIGIVGLYRASTNRSALLAFVAFTLPSAILMVLTPALILIVLNA